MTNYKRYIKYIEYIFLAILLLWPILFLTRGIDLHDTGYYIANYKYAFSDKIAPNMSLFLSHFFGGILFKLVNQASSVLYFRVFDFVLNIACWSMIYKIARKHAPFFLIVPFMFASEVLIRRYPMALSYNSFSIFFLTLALFILYIAIENNNTKNLFLAAFIIGFSVFFRIPNAIWAISLLIPIIYLPKQKKLKSSLIYVFGGLCGILLSFGIVAISMGFETFIQQCSQILSLSKGTSSHGFSAIFQRILNESLSGLQYLYIRHRSIALCFLFSCVGFFVSRMLNNKLLKYICYTSIVLACIRVGFHISDGIGVNNNVYVIALSLFILNLFSSFYFYNKNKAVSMFSSLALIVLVSVPIGTDNGLMQMCVALALPAAASACFIYQILKRICSEKSNVLASFGIGICSVFAIIIFCANFAGLDLLINESYGDAGYLSQTRASTAYSLHGMKTFDKRAEALDNYYRDIHSINMEDKKLIALGNFSMAYLISDHIPFYPETWVDLDNLSLDDYYKGLARAEETNDLPIIAIGDFNQINKFFPNNLKRNFAQEFASKHNYKVIENDFYTIYYPGA